MGQLSLFLNRSCLMRSVFTIQHYSPMPPVLSNSLNHFQAQKGKREAENENLLSKDFFLLLLNDGRKSTQGFSTT